MPLKLSDNRANPTETTHLEKKSAAKDKINDKLSLLDAERKWDAKTLLNTYKDILENKRESNAELASKMNIIQIDILWKTFEWIDFLWDFFGLKNWIINFYWNRELDSKVWLWEITSKDTKYLKVNWVIWKRVEWARDRLESINDPYLEIHEWYKIESLTTEEFAQAEKSKFLSDWKKDIKQTEINEWLDTQPSMSKGEKILYRSWEKLAPKEWCLSRNSPSKLSKDKNKVQMNKWNESSSQYQSEFEDLYDRQYESLTPAIFINEWNKIIGKLFDTYISWLENLKIPEEISEDQKQESIKQAKELQKYLSKARDPQIWLFRKVIEWKKNWIFSPTTFNKGTLEKLDNAKTFDGIDNVKIDSNTSKLLQGKGKEFQQYLPFFNNCK